MVDRRSRVAVLTSRDSGVPSCVSLYVYATVEPRSVLTHLPFLSQTTVLSKDGSRMYIMTLSTPSLF